MSAELMFLSALVFTVVFSVLLVLYWKHDLLLNGVSSWFNSKVSNTQQATGSFRDKATISVVLRISAYTVLPFAAWYLLESLPLLVLTILLAYKVPRLVHVWRRKRRLSSMERDLPIALAMFASALSGGVSLTAAIQSYTRESKTALSTEFSYLLRLQRLGVNFDAALEQVAARVGLPDFELAALSMRISKTVGGNLSETLLTLSQSIQQKLILEGKIRALTSQGVMQAWVMSLLPAAVALVLTVIQPDQMDKLFSTLAGNIVLAFCCLMDYVGFKVIKKILAIDV